MSAATVTAFVLLQETSCCVCGTPFAIPSEMLRGLRQTKKQFYCPSGHVLSFTESEADGLRRQLEARQGELQRAEEREASLRKQRQHLEHQLHGTKGALTKAKKRVGNGVCPCCNRSFGNLRRHMTTKHPKYAWPEESL